jgi:hypothetical protein
VGVPDSATGTGVGVSVGVGELVGVMPAVGVSVDVPFVAPWGTSVAAAPGVGVCEGVGVSVGVGVAEAVSVRVAVSLGSAVGVLGRPPTEFMNASCVSPLARRSSVMHCGWPGARDSLEPVSIGTVFRLVAVPPFGGMATGS